MFTSFHFLVKNLVLFFVVFKPAFASCQSETPYGDLRGFDWYTNMVKLLPSLSGSYYHVYTLSSPLGSRSPLGIGPWLMYRLPLFPPGQSFNGRILWKHTRGRYSCVQCGHATPNRKEMTAHIKGQHKSPAAKPGNDTDTTVYYSPLVNKD